MDRLSPAFRVMLDGEGMPVKLEPPVKYRWQGDKGGTGHPTSAQAGESKRVSPKCAGTPQHVTTGNPRDMDRKRGRSTIHACCMTCSTPQQIEKCHNTCDNCDEIKDIEHINAMTSNSLTDNETSVAMLYALNPQGEAEAEDTEDVEADEVQGGAPVPRRVIKGSSLVRIFLDSGCLAGNYIREDIAHKLAKGRHHIFTPCITNVCGAFGDCQLSKKSLSTKVRIFEDNSYKEFVTIFKVLRKLPYEAIVGRRDMVIHRLTLPNNENNVETSEAVPREMRAGPPVLQTQAIPGAQMDVTNDHMSIRAENPMLTQGFVPLGHLDNSEGREEHTGNGAPEINDESQSQQTREIAAEPPPKRRHRHNKARGLDEREARQMQQRDGRPVTPLRVTRGYRARRGQIPHQPRKACDRVKTRT